MNVGDKLYCIKSLTYGEVYFIRNKFYTVKSIDSDINEILLESERSYMFFNIKYPHYNKYNVYEYFITEKQHRKLKIEKILKHEY